ncbi:hypothetical protein TWF730_004482 [Orbilia blumenaviensis]|uniref:F-box domain-containing protein n=1 Tax=Orbilia blumenaviensis TaxID=1796055 RepID=A0AAV9TYL4_9PEZI
MGKASYKPSTGPFPFLSLPRELRHKIYKYVISFPTAPSAPISSFLDSRPPFELRERLSEPTDLSLLLVNKQIHDEASQVLYGETVFPLRVVINESQTDGYEPQTLFEVQYESPWEEVGYTWKDKDDIGEYCAVNFLPRFATHIPDNDSLTSPIPSYRHLIKHIRVDIIDKRVYPYSFKEYRVPTIMRSRVKKLLLPFAHRLTKTLGHAAKDATVEIKLSSLFLYKEELSNFQYREEAGQETLELYTELIETIWPFTTGSWQHKLDMPLEIQQQHPKLVSQVFKSCDDQYVHMEKEEKKKYQTLDVAEPCFWAMNEGKMRVTRKLQASAGTARRPNRRNMSFRTRY